MPWVRYGYTDGKKSAALNVPVLRSNVGDDFVNRWLQEEICGDDPRMRHAVSSLHCKAFGLEFMKRDDVSKTVWEFYCDLREIGSFLILTVPIGNNARSALAFFELGGPLMACDMSAYLTECQDRLALAVHYADQRLVELTRSEDIAESGLSPRELQCLQRLAKGSRNDRIAENLGITPLTVKLHL